MNKRGWLRSCVLLAALGILYGGAGSAAWAQWPQWGGPNRDFVIETKGLAHSWPEDGPKRLWHRELGDGYSAIVVDSGVLYTMHGTSEAQATIALEVDTGQKIWEHVKPSKFEGTEFGPGPNSTPLIVDYRLFTVTADAVIHCFDKKTGKVLWQHDLPEEFGVPVPYYGYSCSPIAYKDTVILVADRKRKPDGGGYYFGDGFAAQEAGDGTAQSIIAFDQATGKVVWKNLDLHVDYSSPILISFDGQDQLVLFMRKEIIGVNPDNGDLLWRQECLPSPDENILTPVWNGSDLLFLSAAYNSGSRVIRLTKKDGKTVPEELWYSRKLRIHHGNAVCIGDYVYGSSGDFGTAFVTAVNIRTGKVAWRERGFKKVTCVYGDGKLVLLDEDGQLALATATPTGLTVHSKCKVAEHLSWTAPTLLGTTLYVRDRKHIMAFDIG